MLNKYLPPGLAKRILPFADSRTVDNQLIDYSKTALTSTANQRLDNEVSGQQDQNQDQGIDSDTNIDINITNTQSKTKFIRFGKVALVIIFVTIICIIIFALSRKK